MTDAEMRLWFRLRPFRRLGLAFRRQSPVGRYVIDFECRRAMLAVELDGGHHAARDQREMDEARTRWLAFRGYRILRFWNNEVLFETDAVVDHILRIARERIARS